jgi:hypothetical protein
MGPPDREWNIATNTLAVPYVSAVRFLGVTFYRIITATSTKTQSVIIHRIKYNANESYFRTSSIILRIQIASTLLLPRIWYHTQILPIRQVNSTLSLYVTEGTTFRVHLSIIRRPPNEVDVNLIDVQAKCNA